MLIIITIVLLVLNLSFTLNVTTIQISEVMLYWTTFKKHFNLSHYLI